MKKAIIILVALVLISAIYLNRARAVNAQGYEDARTGKARAGTWMNRWPMANAYNAGQQRFQNEKNGALVQ